MCFFDKLFYRFQWYEKIIFDQGGFVVSTTQHILTHFMPLVSFYTPWRCHKARGFLIFSGAMERDQSHKMDEDETNSSIIFLFRYCCKELFCSRSNLLEILFWKVLDARKISKKEFIMEPVLFSKNFQEGIQCGARFIDKVGPKYADIWILRSFKLQTGTFGFRLVLATPFFELFGDRMWDLRYH